MSFPRYPKYKDSGVEWLGEVPEHWATTTLGKVTIDKCDGPFGSGLKSGHYTDSGVRVIRLKNIRISGFDRSDEAFIDQAYFDEELGGHEVRGEDVLIAGLGDERNTVGRACVAPVGIEPAMVKAECFRFRLDVAKALPQFIALQLTSGSSADAGGLSSGSTRSRIPLSLMATRRLAFPSLSEQLLIVDFLDRETAKIDALVGEQRRLIKLLKEKRQAVISHAVTKGLDPHAPMKPSGIEWLGDVPVHWAVIALKRIADVQTGIAKGKDNGTRATCSVHYLRVANVQDGYLDLDDVATIEIPADDLDRYALRCGDVLMNEGGDFDKLGRGYIWEGQIDPCITQNHVFAVRPRDVSSDWLNAITGSDYAQFYFMIRSKQSTKLASISSRNLMELPILLPPVFEQEAVQSLIANQNAAFDALTAEAQRPIDLLQERRTALISAAVTGKIDVRGLVETEAP